MVVRVASDSLKFCVASGPVVPIRMSSTRTTTTISSFPFVDFLKMQGSAIGYSNLPLVPSWAYCSSSSDWPELFHQ